MVNQNIMPHRFDTTTFIVCEVCLVISLTFLLANLTAGCVKHDCTYTDINLQPYRCAITLSHNPTFVPYLSVDECPTDKCHPCYSFHNNFPYLGSCYNYYNLYYSLMCATFMYIFYRAWINQPIL